MAAARVKAGRGDHTCPHYDGGDATRSRSVRMVLTPSAPVTMVTGSTRSGPAQRTASLCRKMLTRSASAEPSLDVFQDIASSGRAPKTGTHFRIFYL